MERKSFVIKLLISTATSAALPNAVSAQTANSGGGAVGAFGITDFSAIIGLSRFVLGVMFIFFLVQLIFGVFMVQTHGDNEDAKAKSHETLKSSIQGMVVCLLLIAMAKTLIGAANSLIGKLNSPLF